MLIILLKRLNDPILTIDVTLTVTTNPSQSGPGGNRNEGVLHIPPKLQDLSLTIICRV